MKMITAYIHSFMLEKVTEALRVKHIHGVTVVDCQGFGRLSQNDSAHYLDRGNVLGFGEKKKIEIVCRDGDVDDIVATIQKSARTGRHGDGKIFVSEISDAIDIRTGKSGQEIM